MSQYTIMRTGKLKIKGGLKIFLSRNAMAAGENRFAPELNEKEVNELFENATPGSTKNLSIILRAC